MYQPFGKTFFKPLLRVLNLKPPFLESRLLNQILIYLKTLIKETKVQAFSAAKNFVMYFLVQGKQKHFGKLKVRSLMKREREEIIVPVV